MIWLSWRQHRFEMLVMGIVIALIAAYLIQSGLVISAGYHHMVQGMSAASCAAQQNTSSLCQTLRANFFDTYEDPNFDLLLPLIVPVLIGLFLGAPLVAREIERGTFRLIWTQSVTQLRWLLVKVGAQLAIILIAFAILSLLVTWYNAQSGSLAVSWDNFDMVGFVPLAYMVFALALGIAAGALLRNTVGAMLATLITFPVVRILIGMLARPNYQPPLPLVVTTFFFLNSGGRAGQNAQWSGAFDACSSNYPSPGTIVSGNLITECSHRILLFQGIDSAIFLALAAGLLFLTYWWIRERIS
jgi:ABC-type transport system involved in multi-copper enzyme maturation permease subunit